jgi:hypothetical protein
MAYNIRQGRADLQKDFMNDAGYQVGDQIHVKFPDGKTYIMPLVGLVADQAHGWMRDGRLGICYVRYPRAFWELDTFNHLYLTIRGDGSNKNEITELAAMIKDKVERNQRNVYRMETKVSTSIPWYPCCWRFLVSWVL